MKEVLQVSCIIPFYNEGERLFAVLDEMVKVRNLKEIICVDDGSDNDDSEEIKRRYPSIMLIRLARNTGKSDAIRAGLKHVHEELIMLFDADLRNCNHEEIEEAIEAMQGNHDIDMLILRRSKAQWFVKLARGDIIVTGERILKKSDLEEILKDPVKGYKLESVVNMFMYRREKKALWMPHSGINTHKPLKMGIIRGLWLTLMTTVDIISATGFANLVRQILFFAKDEYRIK